MRNCIATLLFLLFGFISQGQFVEQPVKEYERTLSSTVLVVLKYSDPLNEKIKNAFEKYWTITPYRFVGKNFMDSVKVGKNGPNYSVFEGALVKTVEQIFGEMGRIKERNTFANWWSYFLFPLDKKKGGDAEAVSAWAPINLMYYEWDATKPFENTIHRVDFIVKQVHDVLAFIKQNKKGNVGDFEEAVNKRAAALKEKTLLVPQELLEKYDIWKINVEQMEAGVGKVYTSKKPIYKTLITKEDLAAYPGKHEVLPYSEIDSIAASPEASKYALFSPLLSDRKYIFVFDLSTKEMIYIDKAMMSFEVSSKNIKNLGKAAGF